MASTRQKYFEESEYYVREYQLDKNGLSREQVEKERRTYGQPFVSTFPAFPDRRTSPISRHNLETDVPRSVSKTSSELVRERHVQHPNYLPPPPSANRREPHHRSHHSQHYIHPIRYYDLPAPANYHIHPPVYQPARPQIISQQQQQHQTSVPHTHYTRFDARPVSSASQGTAPHVHVNQSHGQEMPQGTVLYSPVRAGSPTPLTGAGDIENTEAGFTIHLDVQHFEPKDIKVTLSENILTVVGERIDEDKNHEQTLKRSFSRKYCIPDDIKTESIKSFVSENGTLIIRGSRRTWKETEIDVQIEPPAQPTSEEEQQQQPSLQTNSSPSTPPANSPKSQHSPTHSASSPKGSTTKLGGIGIESKGSSKNASAKQSTEELNQ